MLAIAATTAERQLIERVELFYTPEQLKRDGRTPQLLDRAAAAAAQHQQSPVVFVIFVAEAKSAGRLPQRRLMTRPHGHEKAPRHRCRRRRRHCCCWHAEAAGWRCGGRARRPAAVPDRCDRAPCGHAECRAAVLDDSCAVSVRHRHRSWSRHSTLGASQCRRTTANDETCWATSTSVNTPVCLACIITWLISFFVFVLVTMYHSFSVSPQA